MITVKVKTEKNGEVILYGNDFETIISQIKLLFIKENTAKVHNIGCKVCGIGSKGEATGYVCYRSDCPTRISC